TSCGNDDYSEAYVDTEAKINLVATLEAGRTMAVAGTYIDYTVTMPQSFAVEATVTVRATSVDGSKYTLSKVVVPAGSTTLSGLVEMPALNGNPGRYEGTSNAATMEVDGVALSSGDDPYVMTSNKISLGLLDGNGPFDFAYPVDYDGDGVIEPWLSISLDWEGPYSENDLDLYVTDAAVTAYYETSYSGDRFEGDFFNGNWNPDGVYLVWVDPYSMIGSSVDVRFTATDHNGLTTLIETSVTEFQIVATITKTGGATNDITYVVEAY
ncbi:MAG: hypothetical protein O2993_07930, partial [Bacteroidetes bacterium]|nr:hypothetical protein [Bacteroidota bacterium]